MLLLRLLVSATMLLCASIVAARLVRAIYTGAGRVLCWIQGWNVRSLAAMLDWVHHNVTSLKPAREALVHALVSGLERGYAGDAVSVSRHPFGHMRVVATPALVTLVLTACEWLCTCDGMDHAARDVGSRLQCMTRRQPRESAWRAAWAYVQAARRWLQRPSSVPNDVTARHAIVCAQQIMSSPCVAFSFSGCSWLLMYHCGVATALEERRLHLRPGVWFTGTSSGR